MTSWFDVPKALLAAVSKSDQMIEACACAVLFSLFVWRAREMFGHAHDLMAAVYNSDDMFEVFIFAVLILSVLVWRALKGEPAILKSVRQKGSKRVADEEIDVPDGIQKDDAKKMTPWRAASLAKMPSSSAEIWNPRQAHPGQHGFPSSVSEEAQHIVGMLGKHYTQARTPRSATTTSTVHFCRQRWRLATRMSSGLCLRPCAGTSC